MKPRVVQRLFVWLCMSCAGLGARADDLRVCADPNNLPFSDSQGRGFENKLAELVARQLGKSVSYVWWAQRRGFVRNTLKAGDCDVIMGVPAHYDLVETTRPYYRSSYVFVSRADRDMSVSSLEDPSLRSLKIGVHLIGDDGMNTPPAHALGELGIVENVVGFTIYGDYRQESPPARLIDAVANGNIDVAVAWGPLAGYAALRSATPLRVTPVTDTQQFAPLKFSFAIAIGVRKGDDTLRRRLDEVLQRKGEEIATLLASFGVPNSREPAE